MSLKAANISLEGEYTVTIRDRLGNIKKTIGPHKNFITSMGLSYPYTYAFADCFRYMSLGYSGTQNTITGTGAGTMGDWGTVTLIDPEPKYSFVGCRSQEIDADHASSQYVAAGYREHSSGVSLNRRWSVPFDEAGMPANITFREVMLTPGRPAITGMDPSLVDYGYSATNGNAVFYINKVYDPDKSWKLNQFTSGSHYLVIDAAGNTPKQTILITGNDTNNIYPQISIETADVNTYYVYPEYFLCNCNERDPAFVDSGPDCSYVSDYYTSLGTTKSICRATGAFVRIVKDFVVESGQFFELDYTLNLNISGAVRKFAISPGGTKNSETNWKETSPMTGYHSLIHHGLKLITPTNGIGSNKGPWNSEMTQPKGANQAYNSTYDYGESFIGAWGCPLEPSFPVKNSFAMLSTDNLQFFVSPESGGASSSTLSSAPNTGLMGWRAAPNANPSATFDSRLFNIRATGEILNGQGAQPTSYWPLSSDYRKETADPGKDLNHEVLSFLCHEASHVNPSSYVKKDRVRYQDRSFEFVGLQDFLNVPIRSIVLSYGDSNYQGYYIPYFDCLLPDTGGHILPKIAGTTYSTGDYNYWYSLEENTSLYFTFRETWGSPCSPEVDGC